MVSRSLFSRPDRSAVRGVQLYFSPGSVIVAAIHQNQQGIYYEQPEPLVLPGSPTAAQLGAAFRRGFDAFSVHDKDLSGMKRSDWPAFGASGLRSLKEFQGLFRPMHCYGLNPSNAVVHASMAHPAEDDIELSVSFKPLLAPEEVGGMLLHLVRVADAA